ncbi:putative fatty acyl-CoA reductase 7 [Cardamine amara subsp. amara]|uniref:Fatty acyl-CoA reductase n=1 Tax=Cardamine amara subsp. amara TaxID=228776 RepID=A0ABD1BX05_CARAN
MGETLNGKYKVDINTEMRLVEQKSKQLIEHSCSEEETEQAMKDFGLERAKLYGWPNTYVFTKAMGEMLLGHYRESTPIVIIRPTIITSTISDPFLGWIEGLKTVDSVIVLYGKGMLKCFLLDHKAVCDLIPVDMVVNAMIAAAAEHSCDSGSHTVYHVGSSYRNPLIYENVYEMLVRYFMKSPMLGRNGMPIVPTGTTVSTMARFRIYTNLCYKLLIQVFGLLSIIFPSQRDNYEHINRSFKTSMRLVNLYKPYVLFKGIFEDKNLETFVHLFGTNPKCID